MPTQRLRPHALTSLAALSLASLLAACGGGDDATPAADPLASYKNQSVAWQRCDPTILGPDNALENALLDRLQCAHIRAPMDWSKPERGDVSLALMRLPSSNPAQRRASLIMNPGGPGADGLGMSLSLFSALGDSNPEDPQGALQLQLLARYDMVGFSPRGTGASTRLACSTNERQRRVEMSPSVSALTDETLDDALYNLQKQSEACARNPLTPYINSDATARDMDLMRHLLGDEKLHYLGYSYGTWLGAWYAGLFPEKVGRMVLDSNVDFTAPLDDLGAAQTLARQRLQDEVMLPYAARHPDIANLGTDTKAMRAMAETLDPQLEVALGMRLSKLAYYRSYTETYPAAWLAARELQSLLPGPLPRDTPPDWEALDELLPSHLFSRSMKMNALAQDEARTLLRTMAENHPSQPAEATQLPEATGFAVRCNDTPGLTDISRWKSDVRNMAQQAPLHYMINEILRCTHWGGPSVSKPAIEKLKPLDLLLVQSEYDAATATPGAMRFFSQLDKARMVYVPGEHHHGLFPYAVAATSDELKCVNRHVTRYLLGDSPQERTTTCLAEPKVMDAQATKSASTGTAAFLHPEETQRKLDRVRSSLAPQTPTP
jgi:pimeloyl-ACP methyl ester carboxylesterase